jgi:hypothetical protein
MFAQQGQDNDRAVARALTTHHSRATARALRPLRAALAAVAVTATALVALTAALGGTAASAATVTPAHPAHVVRAQLPGHDAAGRLPASGVTWNQLSLVNGWQSSQGQYDTGNPAWAVKNGMVYLSGSINGGSTYQFATLPPAARPAHALYLTVYTNNGTNGYLIIYPDGTIEVGSSPFSNAAAYTSLAGVSFPAAATAAATLSLLNGWQSANPAQSTGDPAYTVSGGVVHLSGSLQQPSGTNTEFAVLPKAARPAHVLWITVYTYQGTVGTLEIAPNGNAYAYSANAQAYTSLAGISYPTATVAQHPLALLNGWKSQPNIMAGTGTPSYAVTGGVVYLSGSIYQATGNNREFAVLPVGARPMHTLYLKVFNTYTVVGVVQIDPNGHMTAWDYNAGTQAQLDTSLSALAYPVGS